MIPQKFLMMKCIRILFFLHVVGILFFAYKLYNSFGYQARLTDISSRSVLSWKHEGNLSAAGNFQSDVGAINVDADKDEEFNVVNPGGEVANTVNDIPTIQDGDDILDVEAEVAENNPEVKKKEDDYEDEYDDDDESTDENVDSSSSNTKIGTQEGSFKGEKSMSIPATGLKYTHWTISSAGKYSKTIFSPPANEKPKQRLPQALVIGSPNSGIRPLVDFLEIHPQIVPVKKEIPVFDQQNRLQFYTNWFLSQMPLSYSNQVTVGRTHFSHWTKKSVCDLYFRSKTMKIIVVLRDPVSRILSQATTSNIGRPGQLIVALNGETLKVNNDTEAVEWGRYVEYLKMWTQCFPKSQIHIVEWSDIMQHPAPTVHKIEAFLGVPYRAREDNYHRDESKMVYCIRPLHTKSTVCLSEKKRKIPTLSAQQEAMIYRFYSKHNEELFKLLGQRYQWGPTAA